MERTNSVLKAAFIFFLAAILAYFGFFVYRSFINPLKTVQAVSATISSSGSSSGYMVRQEESLNAGGIISPVDDGKKVAAGGIVAVCYNNESALERADSILELKERISSLQTALGETNAESAPEMVQTLAAAIANRRLSDIETLTGRARYVLFGSSDSVEQEQAELAEAEARLAELESGQSGYTVVLAKNPGIFSTTTDGFETVEPADLEDLTPGRLLLLFDGESSRSGFGKLVYGTRWYYACTMSKSDADQLTVGRSAELDFSSGYTGSFTMTVESISSADTDGNCAVVFSCNTGLAAVSAVRSAQADVVFSRTTGILVPAEAVITEEGESRLFTLVGLQAEEVAVEILADNEDGYYLVQALGEDILTAGSTIITSNEGLTDGKVVK